MLLKELRIPLDDLRLTTPDDYKKLTSMKSDLNSGTSQRKRKDMEKNDAYREALEEEESEEEFEVKKVKPVRKLVKVITSNSEKPGKKSSEGSQRRSTREKKFTKSLKEESSESPSSEDDDENEDPDFEYEEDEEERRKKKETKKNEKVKKSSPPTAFVKKEPMSAYELMIQKNREEKMAFLQSLKIDEVKAGFSEVVESATKKRVQPVKRKFKKVEKPTSPPVLRKSRRLANVSLDLSEDSLYYNALKTAETTERKREKVIPAQMSFKEALESEDFYESYQADVNIQESKPATNFTIYDKSVLSKMTLSESNIAKVTPARITALTWYPSPEQRVIAAGDKYGNLGVWNMESENPYVFKTHYEGITNLQFNPYNHTQLISSSYDGILRCGDMVQHEFSEIYNISDDTSCTYFDILSATTYLVAQRNGQIALVDKRSSSKSCEKKHECHDYSIKTVNIHPTDRNFFVTAENKGSIRLWDLRKLQTTPVADITHHKRCVHSAFFSPVTGNSILAISTDDSISIFDSTHLKSDIKVRVQMKHNNNTGRWLSVFRAIWLPNSEEAFVVGSMNHPRRIEIYDKNMFVYSLMQHENFTTITSTHAIHPTTPAIAGANSSGKVMVFV